MANDALFEMIAPLSQLFSPPQEWDDPDAPGEALCDLCESRCPCRHIMVNTRQFLQEFDGMNFTVNLPPKFAWWCKLCWEDRIRQ